MDITITKSDILAKVKAYVGVFARTATTDSGESLYDNIRIESRDEAVLALMYDDAVGIVLGALGEWVTSKTDDAITISQPPRTNDSLFKDVENMSVLALVNRMTALWMQLKYPDKAASFEEQAKNAIEGARTKLLTKMEPTLKKYGTTK